MKCLIISFNRLSLPVKMADWLFAHGVEPVFIDNNSDYQPLLDYYHNCPYMVMHLNKNYGHTVVWNSEATVLQRLNLLNERYIVTDSDLDLSSVPDDFLSVLNNGLNLYPEFNKCALSLEINDLPNSEEGNYIRIHEAKYWKSPLDDKYFYADTDTTFALYREGVNNYTHSAIRTNRPYTCKHISWYYTDFDLLPEDEKNYFRTANASASGKKRMTIK